LLCYSSVAFGATGSVPATGGCENRPFAHFWQILGTQGAGMPGARCTAVLCAMWHKKKCAHEHTVQRRQSDIPCAMALRLMPWSRPEPESSGLRHRRIEGSSRPGWTNAPRQFDTSNGCQDHTVLPYATAPFVCVAWIAHGRSPPATQIRLTLPRPPQPAPRS